MQPDVISDLNMKWQQKFRGGHVKLTLSRWTQWKQRTTLEHLNKVGVYILARFPSGPPSNVDPFSEETTYFGKSNVGKTTSLKSRLDAFDRTAFRNGKGHSGGFNYKEAFSDDGHDLYISICPVYWIPEATQPPTSNKQYDYSALDSHKDMQEVLVSQIATEIVTPLEVCLRGVYVWKWGRLPRCNKE